ncbi:hypothetical protein JCM3765_000424 [Sporobolomyces pararoseus]
MRTPPPAYNSNSSVASTHQTRTERTPLIDNPRASTDCRTSHHCEHTIHCRSDMYVRYEEQEVRRCGEYFCLLLFSLAAVFFAGWLTSWLVHSPSSPPTQVEPFEPPPSFLSLAPNLSINAARSTSTWLLPYMNVDSPSLVSASDESIVVLSNQTRSIPSSLARLYVETWSSGGGSEITLNVSSPCPLYAVDLHVGPRCVKAEEEEEEEDCSFIFATMQTYADLKGCVKTGRNGVGVNQFFLGVSRMGNLYSIEQQGFESGTDLVPRDNEQGFDWSWAVNRQPDYSHPQIPKHKLDISGGAPRSITFVGLVVIVFVSLCLI